jgi:DNA-binding SARP family transcriptional activator
VVGLSDAQMLTPGAQVGQLVESLIADLQSSGSAGAAAELLDRVHALLEPAGDPAMMAMLVATDQIAARWRCEADQLEVYRRAQRRAVDSESETRRSLIAALQTVAELIRCPRDWPGASPPDGEVLTSGGLQFRPGPPGGTAACTLAAFLLGPCVIQCDGQVIESWRGVKVARVVRYLMFRSGRPAHRDMLTETFWPECDGEVGRRNLHQTMYLIRRVLRGHTGLEHIAYENEAYSVDCRAGFWCDVEEFEARVAAGRCAEREGRADEAVEEFERGIALYAGDLLEDMPYEDWALTERDRLRLAYLDCANRLAELRLTGGAVDVALEISQQVLRREPCDETAHRRVMSCYSLTGRRPLVVQQYRRCSSALADTLDLEPSKETTDLYCSLVNG